MKRLFILLLAGLSVSISVKGQQYEYEQPRGQRVYSNNFRFGLFVAPNISWMKPTSNRSDDRQYRVSSQGNKVGYSWGLLIDYPFAENYGIATGFQLTTTGGKILSTRIDSATSPGIVTSADFDYRLQFLEIPFGLKLRSDELPGGFNVFGQLGIMAGINISKKASYEVIYTENNPSGPGIRETPAFGENEKIFGSLAIAPLLFSLNLGGGIEYALTDKMSLYTGLFFNNGFAPDVTNPHDYTDLGYEGKFSDGNIRLNNFSLRLGLFF